MKVGWIGLGKLGLTCALTLADAGHDVIGYDTSDVPGRILKGETPPPVEEGWSELNPGHLFTLASSVREVVASSDVVFVAVPTPHAPEYGGDRPAPVDRRDFEYAYLAAACREVCAAARNLPRGITLVVVSTVLPGTCDRLIRPLLNDRVTLVYNPFFIAMGTTINDFRNPEFVLIGSDDPGTCAELHELYGSLHEAPVVEMSIPSAELTKVSYNTFISLKIVFANMLMEICHGTGADVDEVTGALAQATDRLISPKYLRAGMGDGGACHPRDLIAMSWLAQRLGLSYDLLGEMVVAREAQSHWLAELVKGWAAQTGLPVVVLGRSYKPASPLTYGSPALLLARELGEADVETVQWDPHTDGIPYDGEVQWPAVFVVATAHPEFFALEYPAGSVVIDPWGRVPDRAGVTAVRVGRKS